MEDPLAHLRFHHTGIAVKNIEAALNFYCGTMGFRRASEVVEDEALQVRVCLIALPGIERGFIELVAGLSEASPLTSFLKRGITYYHICYEVPDLPGAAESLVEKGLMQILPPTPARLFDGRRISYFMSHVTGLIELLERI